MHDKLNCEEGMEHDPTSDRNMHPGNPDPGQNENDVNVNESDDADVMEQEDAVEDDEEVDDFGDEFGPQQFSALNNQLDQLQSALDSLESRNDDIHFKLLELLRSSREIRQVMSEENNGRKQEQTTAQSSSNGGGEESSSNSNHSPASSSGAKPRETLAEAMEETPDPDSLTGKSLPNVN